MKEAVKRENKHFRLISLLNFCGDPATGRLASLVW
jgi:hypothetical protein